MIILCLLILFLLSALLFSIYQSKQLKQKLFEAKKEIDSLKKRGTEFVANVSHELKTPLTSIKGYTETLKNGAMNDSQKAQEFLTRIEENAERLSLLINDILDLSKIEIPNPHLENENFAVEEVLFELRDQFAMQLSKRKQSLSIHNEIESIHADPKLFRQVISNLIENAHRYCQDEAVIEIVSQRHFEQGQNWARFDIIDNGPGISSEDLPRIFERFYRADKSRNRLLGGTGLGLAIVKHIMMSHGGLVRVESEAKKGTRFSLLFPI